MSLARGLAFRWLMLYGQAPGDIHLAADGEMYGYTAKRPSDGLHWAEERRDRGLSVCASTLADTHRGRRSDEHARALIGLWADLDHADGSHSANDYPPDAQTALSLLSGVPEPTVIFNTGGGFQIWWLFPEPWALDYEAERVRARQVCSDWNSMLIQCAADRGYLMDHVGNLSRLMRLPGSTNHKYSPPRPVTVHTRSGTRYALDQLLEHLPSDKPARPGLASKNWTSTPPNGDDLCNEIKRRRSVEDELALRGIEIPPNRKIRCPLPGHRDVNPSFHVYGGEQGWHCFGCKRGKSVIDLVMYLDQLDQKSAIHKLADELVLRSSARAPMAGAARGLQDGHGSVIHGSTDLGNARRFVDVHGHEVRYDQANNGWRYWDGIRWSKNRAAVERLAHDIPRLIREEARSTLDPAAHQRFATKTESSFRLKAILETARSLLTTDPGRFDSDPYLLNTPNGTLDLRTGQLREHDPENLLTRSTRAPYDPTSTAPTWARFLREVLPDPDLRAYFQRLAGLALLGEVREHTLPILTGRGANGKTTAIEAISNALGDYAQPLDVNVLVNARRDGTGPTPEIARLHGIRLAVAQEPDLGSRLRESLVKQLTGGDTLTARFMHANPFDFKPTHTLWLATNHLPDVLGTDEGIWRRLQVVPFDVPIATARQDLALPGKLQAEAPGILAWAVEGWFAYQRRGLARPRQMVAATEGYRATQTPCTGSSPTVACWTPGPVPSRPRSTRRTSGGVGSTKSRTRWRRGASTPP